MVHVGGDTFQIPPRANDDKGPFRNGTTTTTTTTTTATAIVPIVPAPSRT
jgi:hypothetical protein